MTKFIVSLHVNCIGFFYYEAYMFQTNGLMPVHFTTILDLVNRTTLSNKPFVLDTSWKPACHALLNTYSMKQPDLYYFETIKMTSQA